MDWISGVIASADSAWSVIAIFLVGIYVLLWKYGGELLKLQRENNAVVKQSHQVAKDAKTTALEVRTEARNISRNITTNHGSKNLGDAIDRITEWMLQHMKESRETDQILNELRRDLALHLADGQMAEDRIANRFAEIDDHITRIEKDQE